jgi:hypothetical protein
MANAIFFFRSYRLMDKNMVELLMLVQSLSDFVAKLSNITVFKEGCSTEGFNILSDLNVS